MKSIVEWRNCIALVALTAFILLVVSPLSNAYDFVGTTNERVVSSKEEPKDELKEAIQSLNDTIKELNTSIQEIKSNNASLNKQISELKSLLDENSKRISSLESEIQSMKFSQQDFEFKQLESSKSEEVPVKDALIIEKEEVLPNPKKEDSIEEVHEIRTPSKKEVDDIISKSSKSTIVIIYGYDGCSYCRPFFDIVKEDSKDYAVIYVNCYGALKDFYSNNYVVGFPSYTIIKDKKFYKFGSGFKKKEEFNKLLE